MNADALRVVHSSDRMDWRTPPELFAALNDEFAFDLDAAASDENALCKRYWTEQDNALTKPWHDSVYVNPPYGRGVGAWVEKAAREVEARHAEWVVMLLAARTDTRWFHRVIAQKAVEVRFLPGRLRFVGAAGPAPFPSMVVVFHRIRTQTDYSCWSWR